MADLNLVKITDYHKNLKADTAPGAEVALVGTNGKEDRQVPMQAVATFVASEAGVDQLNELMGAYDELPDIKLSASETGKVIDMNGAKVAKSGWAIAEFTAQLGNVYLFNPGQTDGNVCVFSEVIDKVETRGVDYSYTYDEKGNPLTASATYNGKSYSYSYANTYDESGALTGVVITDQSGKVVDYLPQTFQTTVGAYQPMVRLNADAALPKDGYCRFVSNFQTSDSIRIVVSFNVAKANLVMKAVRSGMVASMCTQLSKINQKVDEAKAEIGQLREKMEMDGADYYVAENDDDTWSVEFMNGKGNVDVVDCWRPLLIDHRRNDVEGTVPVGELMRRNYLRFKDGTFAPTVGITEEMRAACDVQLYTDEAHTQKLTLKNGAVVTDKSGAHPYDAAEVYNDLGLVDLWDGNGEKVRQLLPWETTSKDYSVMLGNLERLYPIDRQKGKSGKVWSGVFTKPVVWDGIDSGRFPLEPTAYSPCMSAGVTGSNGVTGLRTFFYLYDAGDSESKNAKGNSGCTMFVDGMTYPRSNVNQIRNMDLGRAENVEKTSPMPFAEGGFHTLNVMTMCRELLWGTKYLHASNLFGSGASSNDACNTEELWKRNGGVRYKTAQGAWNYCSWANSKYVKNGDSFVQSQWTQLLNSYRSKTECMEGQMAASWAEEMGIEDGREFEMYGRRYVVNHVGEKAGMNVRVMRFRSGTVTAYNASGDANPTAFVVEAAIRMSLVDGMEMSGNMFCYSGGGCEAVGTDLTGAQGGNLKAKIDVYLQADQAKWAYEKTYVKSDLGSYGFESKYARLLHDFDGITDGYCQERIGFGPWSIAKETSMAKGQSFYAWANNYWSSKANSRVRLALRFRAYASNGNCGARSVYAVDAAGYAHAYIGGSAQCRLRRS